MKKFLFFLFIAGLTFTVILSNYKAVDEDLRDIKENYHSIEFKNLNSKNLNSILENVNGTVIEIEVSTKELTKVYKFNTRITINLESELTKNVVKDLEEMNKRETATYIQVKGFKINRIDLICTDKEALMIKEKEASYY